MYLKLFKYGCSIGVTIRKLSSPKDSHDMSNRYSSMERPRMSHQHDPAKEPDGLL